MASFPHFMGIELGQRSAKRIEALDRFVGLLFKDLMPDPLVQGSSRRPP